MTQQNHARVLDDAMQAIDALPCEVAADSPNASYALRIVDVRGGLLVAQTITGRRPPLRTSLTLEVKSGQRVTALVDCVVASSDRSKLALQPVSGRAADDRRSQRRLGSDDLFLFYATQEIDTRLRNASRCGMLFTSPIAVEIDTEVRGMVNAAGCAFGISAIVRHCSPSSQGYDVGVQFRFLRDKEADLLTPASRHTSGGRREGEGVTPMQPRDDIRDRFRRFAA
jgi:PilZ domain-containing protein